jgi:hypothetical protein
LDYGFGEGGADSEAPKLAEDADAEFALVAEALSVVTGESGGAGDVAIDFSKDQELVVGALVFLDEGAFLFLGPVELAFAHSQELGFACDGVEIGKDVEGVIGYELPDGGRATVSQLYLSCLH